MPSFGTPLVLAALLLGAVASVAANGRFLAAPDGFGQVGNTLFGLPSAGTNNNRTEFGISLALSNTLGTRLVVGAPHHDYTSPTSTNSSLENQDGGGVFLYDYDGSDWNLHWFEHGDLGEEMGDRVDVSADGTLVAVRRHNTTLDTVEVYNVTAPFTASLVDAPISCGDKGTAFSLADNGQRVAISCEDYQTHWGRVMVFDLVGGNWTNSFSLDGNAGERLGYGVSLSSDGNRLAISAPSFAGTGYVSIYEYNGTSWSKMDDLFGDGTGEKFGFAIALSGDGTKLVVGSPDANFPDADPNTDKEGKVHVFTESGGTWTQLGNTILGELDLGQFGRSVAISDNGSRIAASEFYFNLQSGRIRFMELSGGNWTDVASDIEGVDLQGRLGYGESSIDMTGDGVRIAGGALWAADGLNNEVGSVVVFDEVPTPAPTPSPTIPGATDPPTDAPVTSAPVTSAPVTSAPVTSAPVTSAPVTSAPVTSAPVTSAPVTSAPVTSAPVTSAPVTSAPFTSAPVTSAPVTPTAPPTTDIDPFLWNIVRVGDVTVGFNEASEASEIKIKYNISLRDVVLQVFESDCNTAVDLSVASISGTTTPNSPDHGDLKVLVDLNLGSMTSSPIWTSYGNGTGVVGLCVRVDLVLDDLEQTSVNFSEQKIFITIDMTSTFEVINIELDRVSADEQTSDTDVDYGLNACHCDSASECLQSSVEIAQGSDVFICVYLSETSSDVEIAEIRTLTMSQGDLSVAAISDGTDNALTQTTITGKEALIRHQLISAFFDDENPGNVAANGVALLAFVDNGRVRGRKLRVPISPPRLLQSAANSFDLELVLASAETSGAASKFSFCALIVSGFLVLLA